MSERSGGRATIDVEDVLADMHRDLGAVADRIYRALRRLRPPERPPGSVAPQVARAAAAGRVRVATAQIALRDVPDDSPGKRQAQAYLAALRAGFESLERGGAAPTLASAERLAGAGKAQFARAGKAILALDRALGCPYECAPPTRSTP
jgi:hypothetical protein